MRVAFDTVSFIDAAHPERREYAALQKILAARAVGRLTLAGSQHS